MAAVAVAPTATAATAGAGSRPPGPPPAPPGPANICSRCSEEIKTPQFIRVDKYKFHKEHFTCVVCDKPLQGQKFNLKDGKFYCAEDFVSKFCHTCRHCGQKIATGSVIQASNISLSFACLRVSTLVAFLTVAVVCVCVCVCPCRRSAGIITRSISCVGRATSRSR